MDNNIAWDPKNVSIRTRSVEKTLQPLVEQITTMVSGSKKRRKRRGPSKKAPQLAREIEAATKKLVEVGEGIAHDFPEIKEPMLEACKEASEAGDSMREASKEFANDPCDSTKRSVMVKSARTLLLTVTRLLCIADMADVYRLLATLALVESRLKDLQKVGTKDELLASFQMYGDDLMKLAKLTGARQADLKDIQQKEEMAYARATLKKSSRMLLTTTKTYISHPDVISAQHNRDYVINQVSSSVATIAGVAQASGEGEEKHPFEEVGYLANALEDLLAQLDRDDFYENQMQDELQNLVDDILDGANSLADSSGTRGNTRNKIYNECENVKDALTSLLDEFAKENFEDVDAAKDHVEQKAKDLSKQLRKSVVDHVSDSFLETEVPLLMLIEAAANGNEKQLKERSITFEEHAEKLQEVGQLACNMSTNAEGIKMVKLASKEIKSLCQQVINAASTLCARTESKVAQENLTVFRDSWLNHVKILTEAVDDITTIDDFLAVTEAHIFEDVNQCVEAMQENDCKSLEQIASDVQGRINRVDHVVTTEMENYESGPFTQGVTRAVLVMRNNIIAQFSEHVEIAIEAMNNSKNINENAFIDAARLVFEGIRDIKRAVLMRKPLGESDLESENEYDNHPSLLTKMADEQAKQRERLAYEQLKAGGKVQFEVHSEAADDQSWRGKSSIKVNGVEYCPRKRGHNVVVLDEVGSVVQVQAFDTTSKSGGIEFAKFLDDIPEEHVALIAVQDTTGEGIHAAENALKRLGASEPVDPGYRASWAFAGYSGEHMNKNWVSQVSRPRHQGPAMISDMINTPASDMGKILVEIHSEGCEDKDYDRISSIKVNDIERSVMGRGLNVVILDSAGNFLLSKNFDTADPEHSVSEGKRLSKFLNELPNERIVCIAALENVGSGMREVQYSLQRIGNDTFTNPGHNGSFAFIGYTGPQRPLWIDQVSSARGEGPAEISEFIITPAAEAEVTSEDATDVFSDYEFSRLDDFDRERHYPSASDREDCVSPKLPSARSKMRGLPDEDKAKISKLAEGLKMEQNRLFTEVSKWDDQGNDIIVLAKKMCMIMMDMSDFTRGVGPLKTTMDVVKAAEKIAKYGARMNKLASEIAEMCPHSHTRSDLLAYLQRIALYSHQIIITSKVKSDFQVIGGEVITAEVDSATSLIQSAKNLMNAVILTVKASYIASTKHKTGPEVVSWRMKVPEKKPLFRPEQFQRQ